VRKAELRVHFAGNQPLVRVKINGRDVLMLLDTGSDRSILNEAAAARLHVSVDASSEYGVGVAGVAEQHPGRADSAELAPGLPLSGRFKVGGRPLPGQEAIVGLIGRDVLGDYDVDLDFPNDRVVLYQGRNCPSIRPDLASETEELPRPQRTNSGASPGIMISVDLDGVAQVALIDTGATSSVINLDRVAALGVTGALMYRDQTGHGFDASGKKLGFVAHRFGRLKVGSNVIGGPELAVIRLPEYGNKPEFDMILGTDYLRFHRVWLSFASGRTYGIVMPASEASASTP
jgi:hypothetical protein